MQRIRRKQHKNAVWMAAVLLPLLLWLPQTVQASEPKRLIPVGQTVGITMDTKGILVLGTDPVDGTESRAAGRTLLQAGDFILQANGTPLENKESFSAAVQESRGKPMRLLLERDGKQREVEVTPAFSKAEHSFKLGIWVRDSIQGVGTVTYYDPETQGFGALGHGVYDVDTDTLLPIREGALLPAKLTEIVKGEKGCAGELRGKVERKPQIATIRKNTESGLYGIGGADHFAGEALPAAAPEEIRKGEAVLLSDLEGQGVRAYALQIESLSVGRKDQRDMTLRITDERLLQTTGGIVQGMSGSPIIQDGKFIGAVTHVMVNDPTKGYGISIGNMLEHGVQAG